MWKGELNIHFKKVYYNLAKMRYDGTKGTAALLYKEAVRLGKH